MSRPETGTLPSLLTTEEQLKRLHFRLHHLFKDSELNEFHSDDDVKLKMNRLRINGAWPAPPYDEESPVQLHRAYLLGFHTALKILRRIPRSYPG